jgi:cyclopropane fatty-acyl-phospholipid synthase-like methyltransferase
LRDLVSLYSDAPLGLRMFLVHRWWHASLSAVERLVPPVGTILELGCGHGIFANLVGLRGPERKLLALEKNVAKAAVAGGRVTNVTVEDRDVMQEGLPTVDVVMLIDVLHHLGSFAEQEELIARVGTMLRPGGVLILKEVTKSRAIRYRLTLVLDRLAYPGERFFFRHHASFGDVLTRLGFSIRFVPLWRWVPYAHYCWVATKT